nr:hypothetical protein BaRGS_010758 [Batillaria attramentaria]
MALSKFDLQAAVQAMKWIEEVVGRKLGEQGASQVKNDRDVADLLKDGTALCELMNKIKPDAIRKYHKQPSPFQQMENLDLFLRACVDYGMNTIDTFAVKELYEARNMYTVINCIYALGSLAQENGFTGPKLGVKHAARNERHFSEDQLQQARRTVSRQHSGPQDAPSQSRMTPYGSPRQILLSGSAAEMKSHSHGVIGQQYGSNQVASQSGMTAYGMQRQISTSSANEDGGVGGGSATKGPAVIGLQYGSNKVASQSGMRAYGTPRQIVSSTSSAEPDGEDAPVFAAGGGDVMFGKT